MHSKKTNPYLYVGNTSFKTKPMFLNQAKKKTPKPRGHDYYYGFVRKLEITTYVALIIRKSEEKSEKDTFHPGEKNNLCSGL